MSRRTAVLCLYLISAATASAAIVLPHVQSTFIAVVIFAQTLLILGVVMLLEQHPLPGALETAQVKAPPPEVGAAPPPSIPSSTPARIATGSTIR